MFPDHGFSRSCHDCNLFFRYMRYETRQSIISVFDHFHQQNIFCHNCVQDCHSELSSTETVIQKWNFWMVKKILLWELEGRMYTFWSLGLFVLYTLSISGPTRSRNISKLHHFKSFGVMFWCTMYRAYLYPFHRLDLNQGTVYITICLSLISGFQGQK